MGVLARDFDALIPASPSQFSLVAQSVTQTDPNGNDRFHGDTRWVNGLAWWPEVCNGGFTSYSCPPSTTAPDAMTIDSSQNVAVQHFTPFTVGVGEQCSPVGQPDFIGRAQRALAACQSKKLEEEFWTGAVAVRAGFPNRYLAMPGTVNLVDAGSSLGLVTALAELEQALDDCSCGGQHMIHATSRTVTHWVSERLVHRDGNRLVTELGTVVVPGVGYSGSGPQGETIGHTNHSWAYGTSQVSTFLGPVRILPGSESEALDRTTNKVEYRATRAVAAVWDGCCHVGVKVDHTTLRTSYGS